MLEGTAAAAVDLVSSYLKGDARGSQAARINVNLFNLRYIYIEIESSVKSLNGVPMCRYELPSTVLREYKRNK